MQLDEPRPAKHAMQASGPARQLAAHANTAAPHPTLERITALSTAHRLLDPADPAGGFDVGAFVKDLAGEVAAGVDPRRIAIRLDLARLEVAERDAAPIALLINELVTNALRHAFPDERRGHVAITVGAQGRIVVADNGVGLDAAAPSREAFGRSLAEMLARQIGAELRFEDAEPGTRAIVTLGRTPAGV